MSLRSYCDLYKIIFKSHNTAFIVSVTCRSWTALDLISVCTQKLGQLVNFRLAPHTESYVSITCPVSRPVAVGYIRSVHNLKPCTVLKADKI